MIEKEGSNSQPFQEKFDAGSPGGNTSGGESSREKDALSDQVTPKGPGSEQERLNGQMYFTPDIIPRVSDRIADLQAHNAHRSHIEFAQINWSRERERLRIYEDIYRYCEAETLGNLPESKVVEEKLSTLLQQQREKDDASRRPPKDADQWVLSKQERLNLEQQWQQRATQAPSSDKWLMDNILIEAVSEMNSLNISQEIMPKNIIDFFWHVREAYGVLAYEQLQPDEQGIVRNRLERRRSSVLQPRDSINLTSREARFLKHMATVVAIPYESEQTHFPFSDVLDRPPPPLNQ